MRFPLKQKASILTSVGGADLGEDVVEGFVQRLAIQHNPCKAKRTKVRSC